MKPQDSYPILLYHDVLADVAENSAKESLYCVEENDFRQQAALLAADKFEVLITSDIIENRCLDGRRRSLAITFDDGFESVYEVAFPILRQHNLRAIIFVISGRIGREGYLSEEQIRELSQAGMDIQSHSVSHPCLLDLTEEQVIREMEESRNALEKLIRKPVCGFAVPGGFYNRRIVDLAQACGYRAVFTSDPGLNQKFQQDVRLKRLTVRGGNSLAAFRSLAYGESATLFSRRCQATTFKAIKTILGPALYKKSKRMFLNKKSKVQH